MVVVACSDQGPDRMLDGEKFEDLWSILQAKITECWSPGVLLLDQISGHSITAQVKVGFPSAQTSGGVNTKYTHHHQSKYKYIINICTS